LGQFFLGINSAHAGFRQNILANGCVLAGYSATTYVVAGENLAFSLLLPFNAFYDVFFFILVYA